VPWSWPREGEFPHDPAVYMRGVVERLRAALIAGIGEGVDRADVLLPEYGEEDGAAVLRLMWCGVEHGRFVASPHRPMSGHHVHGVGSGLFMGEDDFNRCLWRVQDRLTSDENLDGRPGDYREACFPRAVLDRISGPFHLLRDLLETAPLLSTTDEQSDRLFSVEAAWEAFSQAVEPLVDL